ncbi:MAG: cation:proton antiporter [Alphaproteobacteria bacterium]|nr:cation:proton antiporter [Alphaproteobacteria bacterium]
MTELIHDLALSIVVAWILGVASHLVRQPLILAYLVAGFVVGPSGMKWVHSQQSINTIAELGLIFMLFMIGLEIDLKKVAGAGNVILATSAAQIFGCFALGLGLFLAIGIPLGDRRFDAVYLAAAASLSSTVIIVKVLYDKFELDTLPGRITLGVLVAQDLMAILFLAIQPSLNDLQISVALLSVVRVAALLAAALLISRYTLPHLFKVIANQSELVLVGALAWCFAVAEFAEFLGLSRVMGALIAGVSLSTFPYATDVTAKVTSLRDFFITLFFVSLGMMIPVPTPSVLGLAVILMAFTWASRFVTVFPPLYAMRQGLRASLLPAINLAQMSEFSLVLVQIGVHSGQIAPGVAGAASTAFVALAVLNTFLMMRSDSATRYAIPILKRLGFSDLDQSDTTVQGTATERKRRILILGFYRIASSFLAELERRQSTLRDQVMVVDFNPQVYHALQKHGIQVFYHDIANADSLKHAGIADAEIVISTIPDALLKGTTNEKLVRYVRLMNPTAKIIATAEVLADAQTLYGAGADYVTIARLDQANELIDVVTAAEAGRLDRLKAKLDVQLTNRQEILP